MDRRKDKPSDKRVAVATVEEVLRLYRERYFDLNIRHFHEQRSEEHGIRLSYTWVQKALQGAGLVTRGRKCRKHRRRREMRSLPGMLRLEDGRVELGLQRGVLYMTPSLSPTLVV